MRSGDIQRGDGGAAAGVQRAALKQRLGQAAGDAPDDAGGGEQVCEAAGIAAVAAGQRNLRQHVGRGDADIGRGGMQQCGVRADIWPLLNQARWQRDWQVVRQRQAVQVERRSGVLVRTTAEVDGKLVALLLQLLAQAGQSGSLRIQERLLLQHVDLGHAAELEALTGDADCLRVGFDNVVGGVDLRLQRRLVDGGVDDVGGQGQIGCLQLEALIVGLRAELLDLPTDAAEGVQRVGYAQ